MLLAVLHAEIGEAESGLRLLDTAGTSPPGTFGSFGEGQHRFDQALAPAPVPTLRRGDVPVPCPCSKAVWPRFADRWRQRRDDCLPALAIALGISGPEE